MPENVVYGVGATSMPVETNVALGPLPENKTMVVQKLTQQTPDEAEMVKGLENMESVFQKFQPNIEIDFDNEDGSTKSDEIRFEKLTDFMPEKMIAKNEFLQDLNAQKEEFSNIHGKLKANTALQKVLANAEQKEAFIAVLNAYIQELENTNI
jgi:predicted component of type VI protein secretion system